MKRRFEFDRLPAHLRDLADLDPASVEIGVEQAHPERGARRLLDRRGARQDQHLLGDLRGRDPDLAPGQQVMVAAAQGLGLEAGRVESGIGLGHGKAGLLVPGDQGRQKPALLLVGAEDDDRMQSEDVHVDRRSAAEPGPGFGDRLHQHRGLADAEPAAAIFRRHGDAEPTRFGHRPVKLVRKPALGVLREPVIVVEPGAQRSHRGPHLQLVSRQCEGHHRLRSRINVYGGLCAGSSSAKSGLHVNRAIPAFSEHTRKFPY